MVSVFCAVKLNYKGDKHAESNKTPPSGAESEKWAFAVRERKFAT